jgi:hypothetical protein
VVDVALRFLVGADAAHASAFNRRLDNFPEASGVLFRKRHDHEDGRL